MISSVSGGNSLDLNVGMTAELRSSVRSTARGRSLVIDYFASHRCGPPVGDLTATFIAEEPGSTYVELDPIEDVRLFVEVRLVPLLAAAGVTLRWAGPAFARHLAVVLDRPGLWLEFLDKPGVVTGKGLLGRTR
jgi:hypothetical protein